MPQRVRRSVRASGSGSSRRIRRPRWTKTEIGILRKLYRTRSNAEIARVLGRKVSSVVFKAHRLGLSKGVRRLKEMGRENIAKRWHLRKGGRRKSAATTASRSRV
jgi:hypothetical protein